MNIQFMFLIKEKYVSEQTDKYKQGKEKKKSNRKQKQTTTTPQITWKELNWQVKILTVTVLFWRQRVVRRHHLSYEK